MTRRDDGPMSLWGGVRSAGGSRFRRWVRRRIVPIVVGVGLIAGAIFITTGATLPDDGEPIPVSGDAALAFAEKITDSAGSVGDTKTVSIVVTDTEVTSFLAIASLLSGGLEEVGGTGDLSELVNLGDAIPSTAGTSVEGWSDLVASQNGIGSILTRGLDLRLAIRDPEVRFTSAGEIIVRGYGKLAFVSVPARIVVVPMIVDGRVTFELVEGQLGRLPLPGGIADLAENSIERALLAGYDIAAVDDISVSQGSLRFVGSLQR